MIKQLLIYIISLLGGLLCLEFPEFIGKFLGLLLELFSLLFSGRDLLLQALDLLRVRLLDILQLLFHRQQLLVQLVLLLQLCLVLSLEVSQLLVVFTLHLHQPKSPSFIKPIIILTISSFLRLSAIMASFCLICSFCCAICSCSFFLFCSSSCLMCTICDCKSFLYSCTFAISSC